MKILVLDLGTTYFKAVIFDAAGQVCGLERCAPPVSHPSAGWWELGVEGFRETISDLLGRLGAAVRGGLGDVRAVTFATQANSFTVLDRDGRGLTPLILWPDERAEEFEAELRRFAQQPGYRARTGVAELTKQFMAAKLLWLQRYEPGLYTRVRRLCFISDYLTLWLTGRHLSEAAVAGLSGMIDIHTLTWLPQLAEWLGLPPGALPPVVRAGTDLGAIDADVASQWGLPRSCHFVVGCLDQFAGAIGAGNVHPGGVSETTGTVLSAVRCSAAFDPDPPLGVYQGPAFDAGMYYQMAFSSTSGNLLEAYRNRLPDKPEFDTLVNEAQRVHSGAALPDLTDVTPKDLFARLDAAVPRPTRGETTRAILLAVTRSLGAQVNRLCGAALPGEIRSAGGAARSDAWLQMKADVLGVPMVATTCPEPTSLGAAMLAARALSNGVKPALPLDWVRTKQAHRPGGSAGARGV